MANVNNQGMITGRLVSLGYTVRSGSYADKATGEVIYFQVLRIEDVSLLESLATIGIHRCTGIVS